jgi:hypothetical protein
MRVTSATRARGALARSLAVAVSVAAMGALGCAETPIPVASVPVATSTVPIAPPQPPVVDLSPVAEPADIVAVGRWKSPSATLATLSSCSGVPQSLAEGETRRLLDLLLADAFRGTGGIDGKQLAEAVAMDAPVDIVATLDAGRRGQPGVLTAFSIGLTSVERARALLEAAGPLVELQPGFWRVPHGERSDLMTCAIGPAAGAAPARLVCGPHDRDVSALGPYLVRNLPVAAPPSQDLHAELRFTPVDTRFGGDLRRVIGILPGLVRMKAIGEPRFDHALDEAARALSAEGAALLTDLDRVVVDVTVDPAACLTSALSLQLRNNTSWVASTLAERAAKVGPPPAIYWRAPVDSASASYGRAADGSRSAGILRTLRDLAEGKLAELTFATEPDRKALVALLAMPIGAETNYVIASGSDGPHAGASGAGRSIGWYLMGFDEGPTRLAKLLRDVAAVYNRRGIQDALHKIESRLPTLKLVPAPGKLGPGAIDLELRAELGPSARGSKDKPPALSFHVLLMADGKSTWIAAGAEREELVKRLLSAKAGAPEGGTLAARPGLEPVRDGKALSSGFFTLGALTKNVANTLASAGAFSGNAWATDLVNTLQNLPHKGDTPIFVVSTVSANGPRADLSVHVQRGSFEDIGAILLTIHRIATNAGLRP